MFKREAEQILKELSKYYPVITITGPRQSGKTTLCKKLFSTHKYISLENLDNRNFAKEDPRGFLLQSKTGLVIDEAQNCPELFSYLQEIVDDSKTPGQFILTGSQQFGLMNGITQSLAGRVGLVELLPFSINEISTEIENVDEALFKGFYPPIYDKGIPPKLWYADYIKTYIERDVRQLINVKDLSLFQKFLSLCAARNGQLLNFSELSNSSGLDQRTVKSWISVLEASYIVYLVRPHFKNFSKKMVKTPKLYFYDTGLLCHLLKLRAEDIPLSPYIGHIFESMIVSDFKKFNMNHRKNLEFYFWRDNKGVEVDLLFENQNKIFAFEIKSSQTINNSFFTNLNRFKSYAENTKVYPHIIYGGQETQTRSSFEITPWNEKVRIFNNL